MDERSFSDDERDKREVTSDGQSGGTIRDVNENQATAERNDEDSLTDEIKEMLGWDDDDENHGIRREHIDRDENNEFHLQPRR